MKKYLKKGANYLNYGEDCLNDKAKKIILSDKEFNYGLHQDADYGISSDTVIRLAKQLGFFDDDEDFAAFEQNLAIIATNETGKQWITTEGLIIDEN